jgi:hypothetical protein
MELNDVKVLFVAGRWAQDVDKSERLKELKKHAEVELALQGDEKSLSCPRKLDFAIGGGAGMLPEIRGGQVERVVSLARRLGISGSGARVRRNNYAAGNT